MRHSHLLVIVLLTLGISVATPLRADQLTGWIATVDQESDLLTLDDGQIFNLPEDISSPALVKGTQVRITYSSEDREKTIQCVAFLSSRGPAASRNVKSVSEEICSALQSNPVNTGDGKPVRLPKRNLRSLQKN